MNDVENYNSMKKEYSESKQKFDESKENQKKLRKELENKIKPYNDKEYNVLVKELNSRGIRTHVRKSDHYSANILEPLGLESCVRVSMCHYNSEDEVIHFLTSMSEIMHQ